MGGSPSISSLPAGVRLCMVHPGHVAIESRAASGERLPPSIFGEILQSIPMGSPEFWRWEKGQEEPLQKSLRGDSRRPTLRQGRWWYDKNSEGCGHGVLSFSEGSSPQLRHRNCGAKDLKVPVGKNMGVRLRKAPSLSHNFRGERGRESGASVSCCFVTNHPIT